ncbi:protein pinocchio [Teleopsis dalmanni]|uniref:protein pinocchio n=1 Tax=Teleopsis dalmanni TaxID=139649 RepID=UPI0018CFCC0B|nr:protein pinocchio [Teleopsis dalmanni]
MSLASLQGPQFDIPIGHHNMSVSSISDMVPNNPYEVNGDNVVSIEELRQHMGTCFSCGVSWNDEHVSLDCSECGGYALTRSCPVCEGRCNIKWQRDFTMSHALGKARWQGTCTIYPEILPHLLESPEITMHSKFALAPFSAAGISSAPATTETLNSSSVSADSITSSSNNLSVHATTQTQLRLAQELCARLEKLQAGTHLMS